MEERLSGSKRAFVVTWLLTLGFVLAVGPFGSPARTVECDGADCVDPQVQTRQQPDLEIPERKERRRAEIPKDRLRVQEWRGNKPEICFARRCDDGMPTFCMVARKPPAVPDGLKILKLRDRCATKPHFRTARTRG